MAIRIRGLLLAGPVRAQGNRLVDSEGDERLIWDPNERLEERRLQGEEPLYAQFASLNEEDPQELAAFVSKEGWPGTDDVDTLAREVRKMRAVLRVVQALRTEPPEPERFHKSFQEFGEAWGTDADCPGDNITELQCDARRLLSDVLTERLGGVRLRVGDLHNSLELALVPDNLLDVMYLQLTLDVVGAGAVPRECRNRTCPNWFVTTRSDKLFCSPRCAAAERMRRWRQARRNNGRGEGDS